MRLECKTDRSAYSKKYNAVRTVEIQCLIDGADVFGGEHRVGRGGQGERQEEELKDKDRDRCRDRDEIESEEGGEYDNFEMIDESDMIYLA